jgi:hypothetical protein
MCELDLALIFPMDDAASARLMIVKAECLHSAGVISAAEKRTILDRAAAIIEESVRPHKPPDLLIARHLLHRARKLQPDRPSWR